MVELKKVPFQWCLFVGCLFIEIDYFDVLWKYKAGRKSSLTSYLEYKFSHMAESSLADHNYLGANQSVNTDTIYIPTSKIYNIKNSIKNILESKIKELSQPPKPENQKIKSWLANW